MFFPNLIDEKLCNTPIKVFIQSEELNKYGEPEKEYVLDLKCNYQSSGRVILSDEKQMVELSAKAYFKGDIVPDLPEITGGEVEIYGVKRNIYKGHKCRNLDGSVNFTILEIL